MPQDAENYSDFEEKIKVNEKALAEVFAEVFEEWI